jgi:transposase
VSADLFGVRISLGALSKNEERVSKAIAPALGELWASALNAKVKHTDGTGWKQSGASMQLWTIATMAVTVFKIVSHGSKVVLARMFGKPKGIMTSDRAKALTFWAMKWRQICWAHLARRFISFSERDGPAGTLGQELVDCTSIMFSYWHDYKDGTLSREQFLKWLAPLMAQVEATLERAVAADIKGLSGSCADILEHRLALWTFVSHKGVEPTNNHAEQELRAFVLWRRKSFGTQSERGNLFAERIMSIAHTARKQNKNVLAFLTACSETLPGAETPSLLDARN